MTTDIQTASSLVRSLSLSPHPEGGYYREVYRSTDVISREGLPARFDGARSVCTSIFYLLEQGDFSAFHRIKSDELWHFYAGSALELHVLGADGYKKVIIGQSVHAGEHLQYVVPMGAWFASRPLVGGAFSLLGCTVSPGFDFRDFELAERARLQAEYPEHKDVIAALTRS